MKSRVLFALIAAALLASGCSSDNNNERQRVVCSVQSINGGAPFVSAALNTGTDVANTNDDYVPLDVTSVLFWARPYGSLMTIPEEGAYSSFIITSYDATWTSAPAALADSLAEYNVTRGLLSARVPINDEILVSFMIAPQQMKEEIWYPGFHPDLVTPDPDDGIFNPAVFMANLQITFYGHEEGSEHEVAIPAGTTVTFLPAVSENN